MKYKTIKLPSHPRSGSHWIMRIMDLNFFDGSDYLKHYGGHPWGNEPRALGYLNAPDQAVIYTCRNTQDAANSIFRMRHRFGLDCDDYDKFLITPMKQMYNPNLKVVAVRDTVKQRDEITQVDRLLSTRTENVPEYINNHITSWKAHVGKTNFMVLQYDYLVNDFQSTMSQVAQFLGSDKTTFVDEQKRVGWREKSDDAWTKP